MTEGMTIFQMLFWYVAASAAYNAVFKPKPGFAWRQLKRLGILAIAFLVLAIIMVIIKRIS